MSNRDSANAVPTPMAGSAMNVSPASGTTLLASAVIVMDTLMTAILKRELAWSVAITLPANIAVLARGDSMAIRTWEWTFPADPARVLERLVLVFRMPRFAISILELKHLFATVFLVIAVRDAIAAATTFLAIRRLLVVNVPDVIAMAMWT